jgi:hypothetical protein
MLRVFTFPKLFRITDCPREDTFNAAIDAIVVEYQT